MYVQHTSPLVPFGAFVPGVSTGTPCRKRDLQCMICYDLSEDLRYHLTYKPVLRFHFIFIFAIGRFRVGSLEKLCMCAFL